MTRYEEISRKIEDRIRNGSLVPGERIPSVRSMGKIERASLSTVVQAYVLLESRGWIESRPQSGFYVKSQPLDDVPVPDQPLLLPERVDLQMDDLVGAVLGAARMESMMPFGAACPHPDFLPWKRLNRINAALLRSHPMLNSSYDFAPGSEDFRRQVAKRSILAGCRLSASDLIVTGGCMESIFLSLRAVTKPGDAVLVEAPTYFGILQAIGSLGLKAVEVPSHAGTGVDPADVKKALRANRISAAVLMPNFNNPSGALVPDDAKKELTRLFASRKVPIIEDDLYGDLTFGETRPRMLKAYDEEGWVMSCSSYSKTLAPGFRVGWVAPGRFYKQVLSLKSSQACSTPPLPARIIAEYLKAGSYDRHLRGARKALSTQVRKFTHAVCTSFPEGTRISRPEGGFVLWLELPKEVDAVELQRRCLAQKISISPGTIFSASRRFTNYVRLNCAVPWSEKTHQAVSAVGTAAKLIATKRV